MNPITPIAQPTTKRRAKGKSPTARALADLRKLGFIAQVVEKWNPHAKVRQDLFGCIDVVAVMTGVGIVGVQATGGGNHAARRTKASAEPRLRTWIESGGRFEIWSYDLRGKTGERKAYTLRREELKVEDLTSPITPPAEDETPPPLFATGGRS